MKCDKGIAESVWDRLPIEEVEKLITMFQKQAAAAMKAKEWSFAFERNGEIREELREYIMARRFAERDRGVS